MECFFPKNNGIAAMKSIVGSIVSYLWDRKKGWDSFRMSFIFRGGLMEEKTKNLSGFFRTGANVIIWRTVMSPEEVEKER